MARRGRKRKLGNRVNGRLVQSSPTQTLPQGYAAVYVMWAEGTGIVKVGKSNRPGKRCSVIQIGNPFTLCVAGCHVMPDEIACNVERSFHRTHDGRPYHIRGEWYRLSPAEANRIVADEAAKFGVDT